MTFNLAVYFTHAHNILEALPAAAYVKRRPNIELMMAISTVSYYKKKCQYSLAVCAAPKKAVMKEDVNPWQ